MFIRKKILVIPLSITLATIALITLNNKSSTINQRKLQEVSLDTITLQPFSSDILSGYTTCTEFKADIIEGLKLIINESLQQNIENGVTTEPRPKIMYAMAPTAEGATSKITNGGSEEILEDSYGTNNQVEGVDEVDTVKSDGVYIYAVYGEEVIVVNKDTGAIVSRITIPKTTKNKSFENINHWKFKNEEDMWSWGRMFLPPYYVNEDKIEGLLLDNGKLVVIVSSYPYGDEFPKIISKETTTAFIYNIQSNPNEVVLSLLNTKQLHGMYNNGRSINGNVYITSNTYIDIYKLSLPIDRYNPMFWFMDDADYEAKAKQVISDIIPDFANQLHDELLVQQNGDIDQDNGCRFIVKLSLMQPPSDDYYGLNILRNFAQVSTFNMHTSNALIQFQSGTSVSGLILPTNDMDVYANNDMLVIGARGYQENNDIWEDYTYLVGFDLLSGLAIPSAVGKLKGYVLNQFSMDYDGGYLRVATSSSAKWGYVTKNGKETYAEISPSTNQVTILQKQGLDFKIINEISNLGISESIYSVRFIGDRGYVVTFRTIDPLYILDLSQPSLNIPNRILGELKITGFSNYLHPIDSTTILGIGQDADESTGQQLGLQISLFDISTNTPTLLQKTVVEESYSNAQYDHHAFRYLPLNQILIIPVSSNSQTIFDGFYVYKIDKVNGITKIGQVIHADEHILSFYTCFSNAYMDPRSLVFENKLVTLKGHSVINSGNVYEIMEDGSNYEWLMNFDSKNNKSCMNWFPWA